MLLVFSFANFLSFRDKTTFSIVPTPLRDKNIPDGNCIFTIGDETKLSLTKTVAVFGSKLHTLLLERIISLFNTAKSNSTNALFVATPHDTNLLSSRLLLRNQV